MGKGKQKAKTSENRGKCMDELVAEMTAEGAPGGITALYCIQMDGCYSAWITGKKVAQRMAIEGDITEDRITEVGLMFAQIIASKITLRPETSQLMTPNAPGGQKPIVMNVNPDGTLTN